MSGAGLRTRRRRARGFTLVELVAAMVVLAIVGTIASNIIVTAADGYADASTTAQLHAEVSLGLDRATREIRNIALDDFAAGVAPDIDDVTTTSIEWNDDYALALSGTNLMLTIDGGTAAVLLSDVTSFAVATYDEDDVALAATLTGAGCDAIRRVKLTVTVSRYGASETLRSKVFVRSTMSGAGT